MLMISNTFGATSCSNGQFLSSGVHDILTKASPRRLSFDMASADRTQKLNAFGKKKEVGLQVSTLPLSFDTFFSCAGFEIDC